jgi:glycine/D-amino acid oxidase-like deaminating enzyme
MSSLWELASPAPPAPATSRKPFVSEEQALCEEVTLAAQHGQRIELWSRRRIREEFGFSSAYLGRFIPGDGTYHPFKYACGLLQGALRSGVKLYTRRPVRALVAAPTDD